MKRLPELIEIRESVQGRIYWLQDGSPVMIKGVVDETAPIEKRRYNVTVYEKRPGNKKFTRVRDVTVPALTTLKTKPPEAGRPARPALPTPSAPPPPPPPGHEDLVRRYPILSGVLTDHEGKEDPASKAHRVAAFALIRDAMSSCVAGEFKHGWVLFSAATDICPAFSALRPMFAQHEVDRRAEFGDGYFGAIKERVESGKWPSPKGEGHKG